MIALLLAAALAAPHVSPDGDRAVHVQLDTAATWGIGGQMFLGANAHGRALFPLWDGGGATGSLDLGLQLAYGNEATFLAPWIDRDHVRGAGQRVQAVLTLGHTFHAGKQRRTGVGLHAFVGLNHWRSAYSLEIPEVDVSGSAVVSRNLPVVGGQLTVSQRLSKHVGLNLVISAPFPTASSYAITLASIGLGPTFYLR
jgi:hypothetical protein